MGESLVYVSYNCSGIKKEEVIYSSSDKSDQWRTDQLNG